MLWQCEMKLTLVLIFVCSATLGIEFGAYLVQELPKSSTRRRTGNAAMRVVHDELQLRLGPLYVLDASWLRLSLYAKDSGAVYAKCGIEDGLRRLPRQAKMTRRAVRSASVSSPHS